MLVHLYTLPTLMFGKETYNYLYIKLNKIKLEQECKDEKIRELLVEGERWFWRVIPYKGRFQLKNKIEVGC